MPKEKESKTPIVSVKLDSGVNIQENENGEPILITDAKGKSYEVEIEEVKIEKGEKEGKKKGEEIEYETVKIIKRKDNYQPVATKDKQGYHPVNVGAGLSSSYFYYISLKNAGVLNKRFHNYEGGYSPVGVMDHYIGLVDVINKFLNPKDQRDIDTDVVSMGYMGYLSKEEWDEDFYFIQKEREMGKKEDKRTGLARKYVDSIRKDISVKEFLIGLFTEFVNNQCYTISQKRFVEPLDDPLVKHLVFMVQLNKGIDGNAEKPLAEIQAYNQLQDLMKNVASKILKERADTGKRVSKFESTWGGGHF